jgi:hypothetical protein
MQTAHAHTQQTRAVSKHAQAHARECAQMRSSVARLWREKGWVGEHERGSGARQQRDFAHVGSQRRQPRRCEASHSRVVRQQRQQRWLALHGDDLRGGGAARSVRCVCGGGRQTACVRGGAPGTAGAAAPRRAPRRRAPRPAGAAAAVSASAHAKRKTLARARARLEQHVPGARRLGRQVRGKQQRVQAKAVAAAPLALTDAQRSRHQVFAERCVRWRVRRCAAASARAMRWGECTQRRAPVAAARMQRGRGASAAAAAAQRRI